MSRWTYFKTVFGLLFVGFLVDFSATAYGVTHFHNWEQNSIGSALINALHLPGLFLVMITFFGCVYYCIRYVYSQPNRFRTWLRSINVIITVLALIRCFIAILNVYGLMHM